MIDIEQLRADIAAGTPGPWVNDGPTWNAIIWSDNGNRIAFMAHSNGLNDARDEANARRIARVPDLEAAYLAQNERIKALESAISAAERQVRNGRTMAAMHILQDARAALGVMN